MSWDWDLDHLLGLWGHAGMRAKHARQLQGRFRKIEEEIVEALKLPVDYPRHSTPLVDFIGYSDDSFPSIEQAQDRINTYLPRFSRPNQCISFSRLKDPETLSKKMQDAARGNPDTFGIQLWVTDPLLFAEIERLENSQHPLRRKWDNRDKDITFNMNSHFAWPKPHGYRGIHLDFVCQSSKGWSENMELQILPVQMMVNYLHTRAPYKVLTALEKDVKSRRGKNENLWSSQELSLINPLREYIRALYEADCYRLGLMGMTNYGAHIGSSNYQQAAGRASELSGVVHDIVSAYAAAYRHDITSFFVHAEHFAEISDKPEGLDR